MNKTSQKKDDAPKSKEVVDHWSTDKKESKTSKPDKKEDKKWGALLGLGGGLGIFVGAQIVTFLVLAVIAGSSGTEDFEQFYEDNTILVSFVGSFLLAAITTTFVYLATKKYGGFRALGLNKVTAKALLMVIPAMFVYLLLSGILFVIAENWIPAIDLEQDQEVGFEGATNGFQLVMAFIALVVLAPISEEILFRGFAYQGLRKNFHWLFAAIISSALFGLAHFQLNVALDTFALGIVAAWLLEKTGSLWPAILLHGIKNMVAFTYLFLI